MHLPGDQNVRKRNSSRTSLATLSQHLGLSAAAISRVLNNAPAARSIPKVTQDRIFKAALELNYRPNILARSLRRGHSMMLGVLVPEVADGYSSLVLSGLEQGLLRAGYFFLLISHHHRSDRIESSLSMLAERAVDGIVAIDTPLLQQLKLPSVTVSRRHDSDENTSIVINHRRSAELGIEHLASLGHRQIAIIKGQAFSSDTEDRWLAIHNAAAAQGILVNESLVTQLEGEAPTHEPGYYAAQRLLATRQPFTALFAFNDISAIGAIRALREAGLQVPQDVSVLGFDDIPSAGFQNPGLTTVRQPLRDMGLLAAEAILAHIADRSTTVLPRVVQVDPELVVRESTGPANPQASSRAGKQ